MEAGAADRFDDAEQAHWGYMGSIGVELAQIRTLTARLEADFSAADGGFASFAALPLLQRAIVSDQIIGAIHAMLTNLAEARVHEADANVLLADGEPLDMPSLESEARRIRQSMAFVGFFRAVGSALDNAAALTIGVLRLPRSIQRATFGWILGLPDRLASDHPRWQETKELVELESNEPVSWLAWTLQMRHALMHRPRHMSFALPRPTPRLPIWLPATAARRWSRERARFDPHFRRRPWLPDLQHLSDDQLGGQLADVALGETSIHTMRGVFLHTNQLLERLSTLLAACWDDPEVAAIPPPADAWALERPLDIDFQGFAPVPFPDDLAAALISVRDQERMALAAYLHNQGQL